MTFTTQQSVPFKVAGMATIKHLNVRKEGPDDEKILAVDVKLELVKVDRRLCGYFDEALEAFLWRGDTDALIARNSFLCPVDYANIISGATVQIGPHRYLNCDVKKFSILPRDGGVITLTCSVSVYPTASEVSDLAKTVQDDVQVKIEGPPDLFSGGNVLAQVKAAFKGASLILPLGGTGTTVTINAEPLGDGPDPLYAQALAIVVKSGKPSISLVQRHLKIGYNRAARLVEDMENAGLVSAMGASGQRTVLAT